MPEGLAIWLYSLAFGGAVAGVVWFFISTIRTAREETMLAFQGRLVESQSLLIKILRPFAQSAGFFIGRIAARIEMRLGRDANKSILLNTRIRIQRALNAAGRPDGLVADEFLGLVVVSATVGLVVGLLIYWRIRLGLFPLALIVLFAYLPIARLNSLKRRRQRQIKKMLPYTVDLLSLSVTAGLDFTEALARIVAQLGQSPLAIELGEMLRQIKLGKPRVEALRDLNRRVDMQEVSSVVSALIQTDELGGNLGPILRTQAQQLRIERSQYAEKLAMQAPVKILFPLIFFILPTVFIMIFGPIALKLLAK